MTSLQAPSVIECKICEHPAHFFGSADFAKSAAGEPLPVAGKPIAYYRCTQCHFLFTNAFDDWDNGQFLREIYNDQYVLVDPDFVTARPLVFADELAFRLTPRKDSFRMLDYGGGQGVFTRRMRELGFQAWSHDPFFKTDLEPRLGEKFDLIHCREVIEHTPDPYSFVMDLLRFLDKDGVVFLSTLLQPPDIEQQGLAWWYAAPRNGHISLFSRESLGALWQSQGLQFGTFDDMRHIAWRGNPPLLSSLVSS